MLRESIPCADPHCKNKMRLIFQNERYIGYRCLLKPNSHNFRYDIANKRWEKLIITTKPIFCCKESPYSRPKEGEVMIDPV